MPSPPRLPTLGPLFLQEIEEAVEDLLDLIATFPVERGAVGLLEAEAAKLRLHYSRLFYRAVLHTTKSALRKIKKRVHQHPCEAPGTDTPAKRLAPSVYAPCCHGRSHTCENALVLALALELALALKLALKLALALTLTPTLA